MNQEDFFFNVYEIVKEIPKGYVATYGQIASLMGKPKNSRFVGRALKYCKMYDDNVPAYRIVNSKGETVKFWDEQKRLLSEEGVIFKKNGNVDLKKSKWNV